MGKLLVLNCNILKTKRCREFKLGENAFKTFSKILVSSEKLDLNAPLKTCRKGVTNTYRSTRIAKKMKRTAKTLTLAIFSVLVVLHISVVYEVCHKSFRTVLTV